MGPCLREAHRWGEPTRKNGCVIRFQFKLRPLADVVPWGDDQPVLHWFALTDGWYWIEVGQHALFKYEGGDEPPYVDYYVVRLWEDMLDMAANVLEPVPPDLLWLIERESIGLGDDAADDVFDAVEAAQEWYGGHCLYTGPLRVAPAIRMWRQVGAKDEVIVAWRNPDDSEVRFAGPEAGRSACRRQSSSRRSKPSGRTWSGR